MDLLSGVISGYLRSEEKGGSRQKEGPRGVLKTVLSLSGWKRSENLSQINSRLFTPRRVEKGPKGCFKAVLRFFRPENICHFLTFPTFPRRVRDIPDSSGRLSPCPEASF